MRWWGACLGVWLTACVGEADSIDRARSEPLPADTAVDSGDTASSSTTSSSPDPCALDGELSVSEITVRPGPRGNQFSVDVALSSAAHVAVLCTAEEEPSDQFLVESEEVGLAHTLRVSGLLPVWTYACEVAPTCPTMRGEPEEVLLEPTVAEVPLPLPEVEADPELAMTGVWTLLAKPLAQQNSRLIIYDDLGRPRWWHELPGRFLDVEALYHAEDDTIVWGGGASRNGRVTATSLWDGAAPADVPDWEQRVFHHDGKRLDDGRLLLLDSVPNEAGSADWTGFRVQLFDPVTGKVDLDVNSQRYVDEGLLRTAGSFGDDDPYHANWMDFRQTPRGPELYVSLCFSHQILAIDGDTGEVKWVLAEGEGWTVLDEAGQPLTDADLPNCQHGLEVDGDVFLVYDNGQGEPESAATEWRIDGEKKVAQRLWRWTEPDWNEDFLGDIDWLGEDRVLVTQARFAWLSSGTSIVEVDRPTGRVVHRLRFTANGTGYRAERYDGCAIFDSVTHCPALADRLDALSAVFGPR